jgi:two-component sensor histidine kinase
MRGASSRLRTAAGIAGGWALYGVLLGQQTYALQGGRMPWSHAMALQLDYCAVWTLVTPAVLALGRALPVVAPAAARGRFFWWKALVHLPAAVLVSMAVQGLHASLLCRLFPAWFPRPALADVARSMMMNLDYGSVLYGIVLLAGQSVTYVASVHRLRLGQAELHAQLKEAQLQALQMQMHPHFLFNALNSVAELVHEDPDAAERVVVGLGELLRVYLRSSEAQEVRLEEEVEFLQRYLDIQKVRFEERLSVQIDVGATARSAIVPSLILQPLVENAILHGIAEREADGVIAIDAQVSGGSLDLRVTDNGDGRAAVGAPAVIEGRGLRNTRRRLERLYGAEHSFSVSRAPNGGACASIRIPLKQASAEVGP